jgi:hypothetical protein
MELHIQYINDTEGNVNSVQIPIRDWNWLQSKIKVMTRELRIKKDLYKAFEEVKLIQKGEMNKQTLSDFLNEL